MVVFLRVFVTDIYIYINLYTVYGAMHVMQSGKFYWGQGERTFARPLLSLKTGGRELLMRHNRYYYLLHVHVYDIYVIIGIVTCAYLSYIKNSFQKAENCVSQF